MKNFDKKQSNSEEETTLDTLKDLKFKYYDRIIIGCLNINSIRNKFDRLRDMITDKLDIIIVIETKLDDSFPSKQFEIINYNGPFRLDRNRNGGGVMVYVKDSIPSYELKKFVSTKMFEGIFLELNLRKQKILLFSGYRSEHAVYGLSKTEFLHELSLGIDKYSKYDKFLVAGDINMDENDEEVKDFLHQFDAKCLVKDPTCFKSRTNPTTVDHFITNAPRLFQKNQNY